MATTTVATIAPVLYWYPGVAGAPQVIFAEGTQVDNSVLQAVQNAAQAQGIGLTVGSTPGTNAWEPNSVLTQSAADARYQQLGTPSSALTQTQADARYIQLGGADHDRGAWAANTSYAVNDVVVAPDGTVQLCVTAHTSGASFTPSYWAQRGVTAGAYVVAVTPEQYGAKGDGSTDDTAAINNAINAALGSGASGVVWLADNKHYVCLGAIAPTTSGSSTAPVQGSCRIAGNGGAVWNGYWTRPALSGPILDLRYDGTDGQHPAKIDTRGAGFLELDHVTVVSGGTDNLPILQTTNTTLSVHDCAFLGNSSNSGASCAQDAIVLGGTTSTVGNTATAPFQGYGTTIQRNYFDRIRRAVLGQTYCNSTGVRDNTISQTCGTGLTDGAPFEILGAATNNVDVGNWWGPNIIEAGSYIHGYHLVNARQNLINVGGVYDTSAATSCVHCGPGSQFNLIIDGQRSGSTKAVTEDSTVTGSNTWITAGQSSLSAFPQGISTIGGQGTSTIGRVQFGSTTGGTTGVQPAAATGSEGTIVWYVYRSSAETTNPGTVIDQLQQNGTRTWGGANAGNLTVQDGAGNAVLNVTGALSQWTWPSGHNVLFNIGGSYFDIEAYARRVKSYTSGAVTNTVMGASGHTITAGATPTVAAASGSTGQAIAGNDSAHHVTLTTAAGIAAGSSVATVTFGAGYELSSTPAFALTPKNAASASAQAYITGDTATGYSIALSAPPAAATAVAFDVMVVGR